MSNLLRRVITGLGGGAVVIAAMLWNEYSFSILFFLICLLTTYEYIHLLRQTDEKSSQLLVHLILAMMVYMLLSAIPVLRLDLYWLVLILPIILYFYIGELFRSHQSPFLIINRNISALFYTVLPFALLSHIAFAGGDFVPQNVLGIFLLTWVYDIGAYFSGSALGRHKLFERISPKKSWEGVVGGAILCFATAYGLFHFLETYFLFDWLIIAGISIFFGTLGDLSESMLKRSIGIKDSGNWLPGHGGFLDRFDALLFNIPAIYTYLLFSL